MSCTLRTTNYITACAVRLSLKMKHSFSLVSKFSWITFKSICMYMSSALHWALSLHMLYPMTACWMSARVKRMLVIPTPFAHELIALLTEFSRDGWIQYSTLFYSISFYSTLQNMIDNFSLWCLDWVLSLTPKSLFTLPRSTCDSVSSLGKLEIIMHSSCKLLWSSSARHLKREGLYSSIQC